MFPIINLFPLLNKKLLMKNMYKLVKSQFIYMN